MKIRYMNQDDIMKVISSNELSIVSRLKDGSVLKTFNQNVLDLYGHQIEAKIQKADKFQKISSLVLPKSIVYDENNTFSGYTMKKVQGMSFPEYYFQLSKDQLSNLNFVTEFYLKIEKAVKQLHTYDIQVPDLTSLENIFVDKRGNIKLIDYDGMQVEKIPSMVISSNLGVQLQYYNHKYYDSTTSCYTTQLDKKSLAIIYCMMVLGIQIEPSIQRNKENGISVDEAIDGMFKAIQLSDNDLKHKLWKLYQDHEENEFLTEDAIRVMNENKVSLEKVSNQVYKRCFSRR